MAEIVPEIHGLVLVAEGRSEEARTIAREWPAGAAAEAFRIAEVYDHRGDADRAFEWLRNGEAYVRETRWATWYTAARQPLRQAANSQPP